MIADSFATCCNDRSSSNLQFVLLGYERLLHDYRQVGSDGYTNQLHLFSALSVQLRSEDYSKTSFQKPKNS